MTDSNYQTMFKNSPLASGNMAYLEALYDDYLADATSVSDYWRQQFTQMSAKAASNDTALHPVREHFLQLARQGRTRASNIAIDLQHERKQEQVIALINHFRSLGHRQANTDPLGLTPPKPIKELSLAYHDLSDRDRSTTFHADKFVNLENTSLQAIYEVLLQTYCGTMGVEFSHITDIEQRNWVRERIEMVRGKPQFSDEIKRRVLHQLTMAEGLEKYLGTKYVGQKRFSIEGADTLIPVLDHVASCLAAYKIDELVIGMAHRGRLNVLVNLLGKSPAELFGQFEGQHNTQRSGDVKYHEGFSSDVQTRQGPLHLALAFNPSHLEIGSPVVQGAVRAKQCRWHEAGEDKIVPIIIHGDAAFAGQGVVMETFNLSQVAGYRVGGTVHIILNNQVGFTTDPYDARSTLYCTDVAKMVEAPIFHVNGDDPEMALFAIEMALDFRMRFKRDVIVELVCYRRHGHNEADEPMTTQPDMYQVIKKIPTPRAHYAERLIAQGVIDKTQERAFIDDYRDTLDAGKTVVQVLQTSHRDYEIDWTPYVTADLSMVVATGIPVNRLKSLGQKLTSLPERFKLQAQVAKIITNRQKMTVGDLPIDWGFAEILAYASLAVEGHSIRISGQDSQRGTFAHRHAVLHDMNGLPSYQSLSHLSADQAPVEVVNSILSEEAVMGFDYGFASAAPNGLTIWEAQYGDFANGAQVIIDQFISAAEEKWGRVNGLVLLLPHGYEGSGPEHSSARLERYLQLCAQRNMQVCVPTTPAQVFHMLRRQVIRPCRKPLIVMSPKSFLRHKLVVSSLDELANAPFQLVIPEIDAIDANQVKRVVLCSGKVYYDLLRHRQNKKISDVAILRIEQLYPFPVQELSKLLHTYKNAKDIIWCQEEPKNQGAWFSMKHRMKQSLASWQCLDYAGRDFSASPAAGYLSVYMNGQNQLVEQALSVI